MSVRPIVAREHPQQNDSRDGFSAPRIAHLLDAAAKLGARPHVGGLRVHERFAVGGMASLHFGWAVAGKRLVAVKRVHAYLLGDETFTRMLLDEARLAMHVQHTNVVEREAGRVVESGSIPSLSDLENDDEDVCAKAAAW
jgi:hypothetical protein